MKQTERMKARTRCAACAELLYLVQLLLCMLLAAGAALLVFGD